MTLVVSLGGPEDHGSIPTDPKRYCVSIIMLVGEKDDPLGEVEGHEHKILEIVLDGKSAAEVLKKAQSLLSIEVQQAYEDGEPVPCDNDEDIDPECANKVFFNKSREKEWQKWQDSKRPSNEEAHE